MRKLLFISALLGFFFFKSSIFLFIIDSTCYLGDSIKSEDVYSGAGIVWAAPCVSDTDGDYLCDIDDPDDDNDGVADGLDSAPLDPQVCQDVENDTCDDCSQNPTSASSPTPWAPYSPNFENDGTDSDGDGYCINGDCDDKDPTKFSNQTWYADCDGDLFYRGTADIACETPASTCNDLQAPDGGWSFIDPGPDADCDDEDASEYPGQNWYADCDNDGHFRISAIISCDLGGANASTPCDDAQEPDGGWGFSVGNDCDDSNVSVYPGAEEIIADGVDQNCDTDELCYADADDDGYRPDAVSTVVSDDLDCLDSFEAVSSDPTTDCNDANSQINPGKTEIFGSGLDENCDGTSVCYRDSDKDGYRHNNLTVGSTVDISCLTVDGEALSIASVDCDDGDPNQNPGETEIPGNDKDDNCDGISVCYQDIDKDGYRTSLLVDSNVDERCLAVSGEALASASLDCDDADSNINPGITETWYDGSDGNCDGKNDYDADGDTYVHSSYNAQVGGTAPNKDDCNDGNNSINPGVIETWYDGTDSNCDGKNDYDADGDTYVHSSYNAQVGGTAPNTDDCDDADATEKPGVTWYADFDNDGYGNPLSSNICLRNLNSDVTDNTDCDDSNENINPGIKVRCGNVDSNCNSLDDENEACGTFWNLMLPAIRYPTVK